MAIQNRRGQKSDLIKGSLLPGEYAICTDGTIVICYGGGLTKDLASLEDLQKIFLEETAYREETQRIIDNINIEIAGNSSDLIEYKQEVSGIVNGIHQSITENANELGQFRDEVSDTVQTIHTNIQQIKTDIDQNITTQINQVKKNIKEVETNVRENISVELESVKTDIDEIKNGVAKYPIATEAEARAGIDDNKLMTPLKVAQAIEELASGGGGGGGGSTIPIMSSTFTGGSFALGEEIEIRYRWSSPNEGYGILHLMVDNIEVQTAEVQQGLNRAVVTDLLKGSHTILMYVTDRGGLTTDKLSFTVRIGGLDLISSFDDSEDFTIKSVIKIPVTIDTISLEPIYLIQTIDSSQTRLSGQNGYNVIQLPSLTPGAHKVTIQAESGVYKSNLLSYNIVIEDADTLTIICDYNTDNVKYRDLVEIPYRVSLKGASKFDAQYLVDGTTVKTLEINAGNNVWSTRDLEVGDHVLRINVVTKDGTKTAFVEKRLRVEASSYTPVKPVQDASLIAWFDAAGRTNQDIDKTEWIDKSGNNVKARLVNFNYGGNGWIDGALKCNGNSYVEIDMRPFADDVPNGLTVDIKFKTRDTGEENACVLDMRDTGTNQKGFAIDTKNIYLNSGSTKLKSAILNDEMSKASFVIDRENKISYIYNNAVMTEAFLMSSTEDFYNTGKIYLNTALSMSNGVPTPTLFGDCEIYSIRVYERALSSSEIVQNHIADITDLAEQEEKYNLNYGNMMPTMYFYGDTSAMTKDTKVPLRIKYISTDSNKYGESFDLTDCPVGWQGTSSLQYAVKNYKIKLVNQDGGKYKYTPFPNGIPESTYCLKADYMESSHANNTGMCKFINDRLYDTKTPPQQADPKARTTINGFPIQLYIAKDGQSTPVYMGVFNFNLDKGCNKSFGLDNEVEGQENCLRFEVSSNSDTSAGAFKDDSDASIREDFELNYPDPDDFPEVMDGAYAKLKRMITWVKNSTEESFADELGQYFNKEYLLKYYLQVHLFGMVDNFGKNMMLCTWDGNTWYPTFYDADSQLALDNTGYLKFFSDIDIVEGVYNTSGSKLWTMVSKVFASELSEMYKAMRQTVYKMDVIMSYWYGEQVAKIGELQYNKDMEAKYIQFKNDYLFMLHGRRYENTKRWLEERLLYLDTIYGYEEDTKQSITIRANKAGNVYLDIQTYSPQYLRVVWRNGVEQTLKVRRNSSGSMYSTRFSASLATSTDQEIVIYNARHIKNIAYLSSLNPSVLNLVEATRLTRVDCSGAAALTDVRLSRNNAFLKTIYLDRCPLLGTSSGGGNTMDLSECISAQTIYLNDTKLENVLLPTTGCSIKKLTLPNTLKTLELYNMPMLESITGNPKSMSRLSVINVPLLPMDTFAGVQATYMRFENSFKNTAAEGAGLRSITFGSYNVDTNTLVMKGIKAFENCKVIIDLTASDSSSPGIRQFEISECKFNKLSLYKLGLTVETEVDLSTNEIQDMVITGRCNIKKLKLPNMLNSLWYTSEAKHDLISQYYVTDTQFITSVIPEITVKNGTAYDLSSLHITGYLGVLDDFPFIKINVDLSQDADNPFGVKKRLNFKYSTIVKGILKISNSVIQYPLWINIGEKSEMIEFSSELNLDTSAVTDFSNLFLGFSKLVTPPMMDTSNGTVFDNMFNGCTALTAIPEYDFSSAISVNSIFSYSGLISVPNLNMHNVKDFSNAFINCKQLTTLGTIDTYSGTNFFDMFYGCVGIAEFPELNTSNGDSFVGMFYGCSGIIEPPSINTSKGTAFNSMFAHCSNMNRVPTYDFSKGKDFSSMFYRCQGITSVPDMDLSCGTIFTSMFSGCNGITTVGNINVSAGEKFDSMFVDCGSITVLPDLNTSNGITFSGMLQNCIKLKTMQGINFSSLSSQGSNIFNSTNRGVPTSVVFKGTLNIYFGSGQSRYFGSLDVPSIESMISALEDRAGVAPIPILILYSSVYNKLTDEHKSAIAAKNWTISSVST